MVDLVTTISSQSQSESVRINPQKNIQVTNYSVNAQDLFDISARINPQKNIQVTNYSVNAQDIRLGDLFNIDASGASDGGILVYNGDSSMFEVTSELVNTNTKINGGHY